MTTLAQLETLECPGYTSPVSGTTYGAGGKHRMVTRRGVRCGACGTPEPVLRAQVERLKAQARFDAIGLPRAERLSDVPLPR